MSDLNRVLITGYSALTASGATADETWASVLAGDHGIDEIKHWDLSSWPGHLGGELKNFKPAKMLPDRKLMKVISRQDVMGINAAMQAVEHSNLLPYQESLASKEQFNDQTGVYVGSPGNKYYQQYDFLPLLAKTKGDMQAFSDNLFSEVHPMWLLRILPNNVLAYTGITYGFKGPNHNITNHAVGGMQAIIEAYHAIRQGLASRAVVVAYDVGTEPQALYYYDKLGLISHRHLKPFDKEHDGTLLAEGAAALVLESEESAKERLAKCYGEICAAKSTTEASGLFSVEKEGQLLSRTINETLKQNALSPEQISFVTAHGNGNMQSDVTEAHAIHSVFNDYQVPVTAFKWSTGHTLCASGVLDTILALKSLQERCVPGISNLSEVAKSCDKLNVSSGHRTISCDDAHALILNRGFASMNASLVIKRCE